MREKIAHWAVYSSLLVISSSLAAQQHKIDSLRHALTIEKDDTNKVNTLLYLSKYLRIISKYDTSIVCANTALTLANSLPFGKGRGWAKGIAKAYNNIGIAYDHQGNYSKALDYDFKALKICEEIGDKSGIARSTGNIGIVYDDQGNYPKALEYYLKALQMAEEVGYKQLQANATSNIGSVYEEQGNYPKALEYFFKSVKMSEEMGDKHLQLNSTGNIGIVYDEQGDYPKALEYYFKSLKLCESLGDKNGIGRNIGNIGTVYDEQGDYPKALEYYFKSLKLCEILGDKSGIGRNISNIGSVYDEQRNYPKALEYDFKALKMDEDLGDKQTQTNNIGNIGSVYYSQGNYPKALEYYSKALKMCENLGDKSGIARYKGNIGNVFSKLKKYKQAKVFLDSALALSKNIGEKEIIRDNYAGLTEYDSSTDNYKKGLEDFKKYIIYRDSLINEAATKKSVKAAMNFQFQQQQDSLNAVQDKKDAVALQERKKQAIVRNSFIGGFALTLILALFIYRSYRQKQKANIIITQQKELVEKQKDEVTKQKDEVEKQKTLVEHQKKLVEEKNKDILDSITYAKRLQDAILPPLSLIGKYFPESFVLYKPKDIVAGDFYWMERVTSPPAPLQMEREERGEVGREGILIAACDCTGHGVPGALVSVVCSNALNRAVKEFHITQPGKILDKTRELVLETFEKSEGSIQDGMDISLLAIGPARTVLAGGRQPIADSLEIQWAGAYNSLWYIQNGLMQELVADKQPIGKVDNPTPFNTHSLALNKGDTLYLFTDGFADQFGGPKGKKFKYQKLKEELLTISRQPLARQKQILEKEFENWKGELEQTDDVCVIGIRI